MKSFLNQYGLYGAMVVEIQNTWWHIEDTYSPSNAKMIRHVMDLFTDEEQISYDIKSDFVGLRVHARNLSNREIAFLEGLDKSKSSSFIILNLGSLEDYPNPPVSHLKEEYLHENLKHVKLEIEYIQTKPSIINVNDFRCKFAHKKYSSTAINGLIQPELYFTLPLGWRMGGNSFWDDIFKRKLCLFDDDFDDFFKLKQNREGYSFAMKCIIDYKDDNLIYKTFALSYDYRKTIVKYIDFNVPHIKLNDGKHTCNYVINKTCYSKIKNIANHALVENNSDDKSSIRFEYEYESKMSNSLVAISLIPFVFILSPLILFFPDNIHASDITLTLFIAIITVSFHEYNLIREGYNVPHKSSHVIIYLMSIFVIIYMIYNCLQTPTIQI